MKVGIIGGGRVGSRLAASLREAGVLAGITAASEQHSAQLAQQFGVSVTDNAKLWQAADVLLLTVPDRLIGTVAEELAQSVIPAAKVVLHVSGSVGLEPLAPLTQLGAHVACIRCRALPAAIHSLQVCIWRWTVTAKRRTQAKSS